MAYAYDSRVLSEKDVLFEEGGGSSLLYLVDEGVLKGEVTMALQKTRRGSPKRVNEPSGTELVLAAYP